MPVTRLNHAVLFVRNLDRSVAFYRELFDMETVTRMGDRMAFLRARGSSNHHDLGLAAVGEHAPSAPHGAVGLYHLAWEVERIDELVPLERALAARGALVGASDHGATKSLYGRDPDGNEFEIMWLVPREQWGAFERDAVTRRLDLPREIARYSAMTSNDAV